MESLIFGGLLFGVLAVLTPLLLVLGLVVVVALRGDEGETTDRAASLYLVGATAAALLTLVVAVTALTAGIAELPGNNGEPVFDDGWFEYAPDEALVYDEDGNAFPGGMEMGPPELRSGDSGKDDDAVQSIAVSLIAAAVALAVLRFHWPQVERLRRRTEPASAAGRVHTAYCYVLCFAAVLTLLATVSALLYSGVELVAPDTTDAGDRGDIVEQAVPLLTLSLAALAVFRVHWMRVPPPTFLRPIAAEDDDEDDDE